MEKKHFDLKEIKDPSFLKTLSYKEMDVLAEDIRSEIIRATSCNGGHISSNLGVVELTIALHRIFDFKEDKLLLDVGHQCYTHKILTGRSLDNLRKHDGISGFQKRSESIYDCFEAGHSSTSISSAYGMAVARDINKEKYNIVAVIGDGAFASGLTFEGLNNIGHDARKVIVILNDNDMSIAKATGGTAKFLQKIRTSVRYDNAKRRYQRIMCKTRLGLSIYNLTRRMKNKAKSLFLKTNIFDSLGFVYLGPIDGHNIKAMEKALIRAKKYNKPICIHIHTKKGKGYKFAEEDVTGNWHGVGPFNIQDGCSKNILRGESWSQIYGDITFNVLSDNPNTILINPAMVGGSKLEKSFDAFPSRCFDVGICEEHAITMASGVALNGMHPIVSIYSTFLQRSYDEVSQDLCRMNLNATLLIDRAGLVGEDGETHQGIFDEAMLYTIPNTVITMASNCSEANILLNESLNNHGVFAIRYPKTSINCSKENTSTPIKFGDWLPIYKRSKKQIIVSCGPIINDLLMAIKDYECDLINAIYLKPIMKRNIDTLCDYQKIIIYNPYATSEGFADNLIKLLIQNNYKGKIITMTLPTTFIKQGSIHEQLYECHMSVDDLIKKIM